MQAVIVTHGNNYVLVKVKGSAISTRRLDNLLKPFLLKSSEYKSGADSKQRLVVTLVRLVRGQPNPPSPKNLQKNPASKNLNEVSSVKA